MTKSRRNSPLPRDLTLHIPTPPPMSSLVESLKPTPKATPHCHCFDLREFDHLDQLTDHGIPYTAVYKVVHRPTGDLYALRVISVDKPESVRRFAYNHATSVCKIRAANVVNYFDAHYAADDRRMGRHPFNLQDLGDLERLMHAICRREPPQLPLFASLELRDFVNSCLQKDNTKRWTAAELLKHPFILGRKECTK